MFSQSVGESVTRCPFNLAVQSVLYNYFFFPPPFFSFFVSTNNTPLISEIRQSLAYPQLPLEPSQVKTQEGNLSSVQWQWKMIDDLNWCNLVKEDLLGLKWKLHNLTTKWSSHYHLVLQSYLSLNYLQFLIIISITWKNRNLRLKFIFWLCVKSLNTESLL